MNADVVAGNVAAGQHGLITTAQAVGGGLSQDQIDRRVRTGVWRREHRGVFALVGAPRTWHQMLLALILRTGEGSVASHLSAATLHRFPDATGDLPEVTARPGFHPKVPGARVHRPAHLPDHDVRVVAGIPTTSYARTLIDCTGRWSLGQVARALDAGLVRRDVTLWSVERSLTALGQAPGRHPSKLWTLIAERGSETQLGESRPELRVFRVLRDSGLPTPTQQHRVRVGDQSYRLDLAYPELKVAIEYDGWETHSSRRSFDSDRRRDRLLQLDGWVVLRITSTTPDAEIVETVRTLVP